MRSQSLHDISNLLNVLVRRIGEPGDLTSVLRHIAQTARTYFDADTCNIFASNPITGHFIEPNTVTNPITGEFIEPYTVAGEFLKYRKESPGRPSSGGLTERVLKQGILLVEDVETAPEYQSTFTRLEEIRSFVGLALFTKYTQKPLAVLYLNFRQAREFTLDEYELYQIFASQVSFMLQETWLLLRYQEVARIGQEINQELGTVTTLFEKLQKHIGNILDTSHVLLLGVYQPLTGTLDLYFEEEGNFVFQENSSLEGACRYVIETKQMSFIKQLSKEYPLSQPLHIEGTGTEESLIFVPLVLRDVSLGVLSIQHSQPNYYNQEDLFILHLLANYISLALHNIRLHGSLDQLNEAGQKLTLLLESEKVLDATAEQILQATKADLVVLYPYEPSLQHFILPPRIAGTLLNSTLESMSPSQPDDISLLMLRQIEPIFAKESAAMYTALFGGLSIRQGNFQERENIRSTAALPLRVGDVSVGVLFINFRQVQHFYASQKLLFEGLAHFASIAIKNAQEYDTLLRRRVRELEILQSIGRELARNLDLNSVLNTLLKLAREHVPAEACSIMLPNVRTQVLEMKVALGRDAEVRRATVVSLQETKGITRWVLEQKRPARVDNVHDLPWRDIYLPVTAEIVSELDVPLLDDQEVVGILNFESTKESAFRQEDQDFLLTLAGQGVLAIKNAQAYEREKRLAAEAQALNQISKEITSQLESPLIFDLILEKALELTHSNLGNLMLYDPKEKDFWMAAERGVADDKKNQRQRLDQGIVGYAARNKKLLNVDPTQQPWSEIYLEFFPGAHSELAVPLLAGNDLHGVLNIESSTPNNFSESDERLMLGLADLAVIAVQNTQAYEREKHFAAEAQVLNQISKEITSQLDLIYVFDLILEKGLELTRSTLGSLHLYDPDLNELHMVAERGVAQDKRNLHQKLGQGIVGYVAKNKHLLNVKDVSQEPWNKIYEVFIPETRSELAAPMFAGNLLRGVLNIESSSLNHFSESDERLLQGLADLAVVALQNAERYEKAEREAQRFQLLYQAGQELSKITELAQLDQAYDAILQIAVEHGQSQVVILRYDEETEELVLVRASLRQDSPLFSRMNLNEGLNGQVARERHTIVVYDTNNPPSGVVSLKLSDPATQSLVVIPIKFKDRYYGNLGLSHKDVGYFRGSDIDFFEGLAQELGSTIYRLQTAQARQEFEQRALSAEEMSLVGQLAFELTHRLGNDLGLVESYVSDIQFELEMLGTTSEFIARKLDNIVSAVRTVLDLSGALKRGLAKPHAIEEEAGGPMIVSPRELFEAVQAIVPLPPSVELRVEIDDDVAAVRVIRGLVIDILLNLITNAVDALPAGGKITLRAYNATGSVILEVSDTGVGIPEDKQSKVFDLFFSTKGSSGFGLWSARHNARRNHGDLRIQSQPGQGTTFILLLPREEVVQ